MARLSHRMVEVMRETATKSADYLSEWPRGYYWDSNRHTKNSLESLHQPKARPRLRRRLSSAPALWVDPLARSGSGPVGILTRCQCALRSSSTPVS